MTWYKSLSGIEVFLCIAFVVAYAAYIYRMVQIAKVLKTDFRTLAVKLIWRSVYFALIIVCLLGPSFGDTSREVKSVGKDIMICVDLSESMNAFDVQPSRLERVKFELKNIVDAFSSDRIGLIIFSNEAFVQCPLTYDQSALNLFIETLHTGLVPDAGTSFGPPLKLALNKLSGEEATTTQQKSKIIILISDGEDFGEITGEAVSEIDEAGYKLFTLGVGTDEGSRIRTPHGFKTDREGREVVSTLRSQDLKQLAIKTDGKYFEINGRTNDVERLINTINSIEGELRDTRRIDVSANKYYYFLALALLLLAADVLVSFKMVRI